VTARSAPGRSVATRRALVDVVRAAVLGSYGVTEVARDGRLDRILAGLRLRRPGVRIRLDRGLEIDLDLVVAFGLPVAEVARQVDSAVRYAIRRAFGHEVRRLTIHVGGLHYQPASVPPTREPASHVDADGEEQPAEHGGNGTGDPLALGPTTMSPSGDERG
jgi:uncharacterized alkaline shock family protein YloU